MRRTFAGSAPLPGGCMALFFDVAWFDAALADRGLDRQALAKAAGLEPADLNDVFENVRAATASELSAFAELLGRDAVEVSLRSGVANRQAPPDADASTRIESIEARLDAIDNWIDDFERQTRKRA